MIVETAERRDQHEQRRARQMEIGDERVDRAEAVAGRDEDRGLALEGPDGAALVGRAFDQARRSRADRDDPPAARARGVERRRGRGVDASPFGVHLVIARVVRLDRQEGAGADVQGHAMEARPRRLDALEQRRREMQTGGRRGHGAVFAREHGLIVGAVGGANGAARGDVGRQRRRAEPLDRLVERRAVEGEGERDLARLALLLDLRVERAEQARRAFAASRRSGCARRPSASWPGARARASGCRRAALIKVASICAAASPRTRIAARAARR